MSWDSLTRERSQGQDVMKQVGRGGGISWRVMYKKMGQKSSRRVVLNHGRVFELDIMWIVVMGRVVMRRIVMGRDVMGQVVRISAWLSLNLPLAGLRLVGNLHLWSYCLKGLWPETFHDQCKAQLVMQRTINIVVYNTYNQKFIHNVPNIVEQRLY
jgi:hypothetical protein